MQLSYNNQAYWRRVAEADDPGITRMGRQVIKMNRVGLVIDMSHSTLSVRPGGDRNFERPIAVCHAIRLHGIQLNKSTRC